MASLQCTVVQRQRKVEEIDRRLGAVFERIHDVSDFRTGVASLKEKVDGLEQGLSAVGGKVGEFDFELDRKYVNFLDLKKAKDEVLHDHKKANEDVLQQDLKKVKEAMLLDLKRVEK